MAKNKGKGQGMVQSSLASKMGECSSASSMLDLNVAPDFATVLMGGLFLECALKDTAAHGFSAPRAAHMAALTIGRRLHKAWHKVWRIVSREKFWLEVMDHGYKIRWRRERPQTRHNSRNPPTSEDSEKILDSEVKAMLEKNFIRIVDLWICGVISGFFTRQTKRIGKYRPIISMNYTNSFIENQKFHMTMTKFVTSWGRAGYFFTSFDCSDAYFANQLDEREVKYTRFRWRGTIYEFLCIRFGLGPSARIFTKKIMVVIRFLKKVFNILLVTYIDYLLIQAEDEHTCRLHAEITILFLQDLGYRINFEKSVLCRLE